MRVTIPNFGGIVPRLPEHNLAPIQALVAHDVKLRNGKLEPWREVCHHTAAPADAQTVFLHGCCSVTWDTVVETAEMPPDWKPFYITGRRPYLEAVVLDRDCDPTYYRVGVPTPMQPPNVSAPEQCSRSADARAYVYTYYNIWYEESAPSPVSPVITVNDGDRVTVSNIPLPPEGYGIVGANIYRATTGFRPADGKEQKELTGYLYVGSIQFPSTTLIDTVKMKALGPAVATEKVREPPHGLRNVTKIEGVARLAGSTKNRVHFSENFQPYNWPAKYDLALDSTIIHMGCLERKLFVTTDTTPYIIDTSSCEDNKCTPVTDLGLALPDISCKSASSAITTRHGFIYASPIGVILIGPTGKWYNLTAKWLGEEDWQRVQPDTARFAYWEGFLFIVTDAVTFLLNIDGDPYGDMQLGELVTLSDKPKDMKVSNTGKLFFLNAKSIDIWNTGAQWRAFTWESRALTAGADAVGNGRIPDTGAPTGPLWSPASAKIGTAGAHFKLKSEVHGVVYERDVYDDRPFRLPRIGRSRAYTVELSGIEEVLYFDMGTSNWTVPQGR